MAFFTKKHTYESVLQTIEAAKKLLKDVEQEKKLAFFDLLELRIQDFEEALKKNPEPYEKQRIISQYYDFAKTVLSCLSKPQLTKCYTENYHHIKDYYSVGITDVVKEPVRHNISLAATILGAVVILASLAAFTVNPLISAVLLPIGITLLAPGVVSLLTPDPLDISAKQLEERMIFQAGAQLIDPSLSFDEAQGYEGSRNPIVI